ncbi:hypothetical protein Tco_0396752 [Tanacetum coccineum]
MATKPLTPAAIAMTEKKMDMSLDDIIKMSKNGTVANKAKQQRIPNKNQKFTNNVAQDKSMKLRRFMDSRSSVRQGRARKAAVAPIRIELLSEPSIRLHINQRAVSRQFQNRPQSNGSFAAKQQTQPKVVSKQRPQQTLDSLFANMKEERMKIMSHQQNNNNSGRSKWTGQQRPRPPGTEE